MTLKARFIKEKKYDLIKIKTFLAKDLTEFKNNLCIDWEKIFANQIPNKGLVPRVYKEFSKLNKKKTSNNNGQRIR